MQSNARPNRKERVGIVVSDKMDKTITVKVSRVFRHPKYKKMIRASSKFKAHDENGSASVGDFVRIEETRPLSKTKRWRLVEIVQKASSQAIAEPAPEERVEEPKKEA